MKAQLRPDSPDKRGLESTATCAHWEGVCQACGRQSATVVVRVEFSRPPGAGVSRYHARRLCERCARTLVDAIQVDDATAAVSA